MCMYRVFLRLLNTTDAKTPEIKDSLQYISSPYGLQQEQETVLNKLCRGVLTLIIHFDNYNHALNDDASVEKIPIHYVSLVMTKTNQIPAPRCRDAAPRGPGGAAGHRRAGRGDHGTTTVIVTFDGQLTYGKAQFLLLHVFLLVDEVGPTPQQTPPPPPPPLTQKPIRTNR